MSTKQEISAVHTAARSEVLKAHADEYRAAAARIAAERGVTLRTRRTTEERLAALAEHKAAVEARAAERAAAAKAKADAKRAEQAAKLRERLAALEGPTA